MPLARASLIATALVLTAGAVQAQPYRVVGPDGRVTYSDQPPAVSPRNVSPARAGANSVAAQTSATGAGLPYELARTAQRYPVTLYSGSDCAPCASGRDLLITRGIPFSERTVSTNQDIDALKRLGGDAGLPQLAIGGQRLRGFSDAEWTQYLDAAGYPKTSQLPRNYSRAAATPLVAVTAAPAVQATPAGSNATANAEPAAPSVAPVRPSATNPAGIRF